MHKLEKIFSFDNLMKCANKSLRNVRWKSSSQNFENTKIFICSDLRKSILNGKYKPKPFMNFTLRERGKIREIEAPHITDRVVQKCFCDNYFTPLIKSKLIYDNGACIDSKGVSFTRKRTKIHLKRFLRNNDNGYILQFDFKKYFYTIPHDLLLNKMKKIIEDEKLYNLYKTWIDKFKNGIGLGLGSQISQISALYYMNDLDQFIKHKLKIKYYVRYMDDCIIFHHDKEYLKYCLLEIEKIINSHKMQLNKNKTYITKISKGFTFLKRKYIINNKRIVLVPKKDTFKRMRRKIKAIKTEKELSESYNSWKSSLKGTKHFNSLSNIKERIYARNKNRNN